jgi:hypothetical protein
MKRRLKTFKEWVELPYKYAGDVSDPSFFPKNQKSIKKMIKKLNKIYFSGKKS